MHQKCGFPLRPQAFPQGKNDKVLGKSGEVHKRMDEDEKRGSQCAF